MSTRRLLFYCLPFILGSSFCTAEEKQPTIEELSDAFGHFIGQDLKREETGLNIEAVITGIRKGAAGLPSPCSEEEYEQLFTALRNRRFQEASRLNLRQAETFIHANAKQEAVIELIPSKLQYKKVQAGQGAAIEAHSTPLLRFTGQFIDGMLFAATEPGTALPVPLDQMIPGFQQGVIGMKEGEERRLFIHPDLAYGISHDVPPNALLIFDVKVVKADQATQQSSRYDQKKQKKIATPHPEHNWNPPEKSAKHPSKKWGIDR